MVPTIGRLVIYNTTEAEQQKMRDMQNCNVQQKLPAIVVAVWGDTGALLFPPHPRES